jgi:hypothetical protein
MNHACMNAMSARLETLGAKSSSLVKPLAVGRTALPGKPKQPAAMPFLASILATFSLSF